jgi:SAM-dependent methyltransferase
MIGYPRFASLALPLVTVALALFAFMHLARPEVDCVVAVEPRTPAPAARLERPVGQPRPADETKAAFEKIYDEATWGELGSIGTSGSGSTLQATYIYRRFLAQFMADNKIQSVVDAGCGDWEFSHKIDWTGIDYKGYDIVAKVVEANKAKYAKANVQFFVGNIVEDDLPAADLLISKHVLQHLPNADVQRFLDKQVKKYKHVLLTNGVHAVLMTGSNRDIKPGDYRELDITRPPFNVRATKPLTWWANGHMHQVVHIDHTAGR